MTTNHRTTDSSGARYFDYRPGKKYWWRYLPVSVGLTFVYVVLVLNGLKPFSVFWFPAVVIVVFLDIIGIAMVRFKSPRVFRTDGEKLLIEWADGEMAVSLDNVFGQVVSDPSSEFRNSSQSRGQDVCCIRRLDRIQ